MHIQNWFIWIGTKNSPLFFSWEHDFEEIFGTYFTCTSKILSLHDFKMDKNWFIFCYIEPIAAKKFSWSNLTLVLFRQTCWDSQPGSQRIVIIHRNYFWEAQTSFSSGQRWMPAVSRSKQWSVVVETVIYFHTFYQGNNK